MAHRVRVRLGLGLGFVDIRVRVGARARVSVRVRFCGHYVDIVAANCGRLRLQPTLTAKITYNMLMGTLNPTHSLTLSPTHSLPFDCFMLTLCGVRFVGDV